jgi:hypothetical protein
VSAAAAGRAGYARWRGAAHIIPSGIEDFVSSRLHSDKLSLGTMFQPSPFNSAGGRPRGAGSFVVERKKNKKK